MIFGNLAGTRRVIRFGADKKSHVRAENIRLGSPSQFTLVAGDDRIAQPWGSRTQYGADQPWPQRVETTKQMIAAAPAAGTNTVLITHFPNVKAALGVQIGFGDAAILKPDGHGGVTVVARITAKEWAAF